MSDLDDILEIFISRSLESGYPHIDHDKAKQQIKALFMSILSKQLDLVMTTDEILAVMGSIAREIGRL